MASAPKALLLLAALLEAAVAFVPPHGRGDAGSVGKAGAAAGVHGFEITARRRATQLPQPLDGIASWRIVTLGLSLGLAAAILSGLQQPVFAQGDIENGEQVFLGNCAACHAGGNNAVQPDKKLKKEALTQYGMYDIDRIKYQVTNGKNAMPAFGERLGSEDISDVAAYVISQADKGW